MARGAATAPHRHVTPHHGRPFRLDRRRGIGPDYRQTRCHHGRGQAGLSRFRLVSLAGDRRLASGAGRRLCVLRRARWAGVDPVGRSAIPNQKDRGRCNSLRTQLLSADLGRCNPHRARLRHERPRLRGDHDRWLRLSMRVCAIAAALVLAMDPSVLVGVSFQMSFGAVVALIAVYETYGARLGRLLHGRSLLGQVLGYCGGVVVTTAVVTLGTYPFAIYHFHHIALYSPLANVIAVPLSAMWTLPWGWSPVCRCH